MLLLKEQHDVDKWKIPVPAKLFDTKEYKQGRLNAYCYLYANAAQSAWTCTSLEALYRGIKQSNAITVKLSLCHDIVDTLECLRSLGILETQGLDISRRRQMLCYRFTDKFIHAMLYGDKNFGNYVPVSLGEYNALRGATDKIKAEKMSVDTVLRVLCQTREWIAYYMYGTGSRARFGMFYVTSFATYMGLSSKTVSQCFDILEEFGSLEVRPGKYNHLTGKYDRSIIIDHLYGGEVKSATRVGTPELDVYDPSMSGEDDQWDGDADGDNDDREEGNGEWNGGVGW